MCRVFLCLEKESRRFLGMIEYSAIDSHVGDGAMRSGTNLCHLVILAIAVSPAAWAQIEEVVVLTRKTEERLQDVPIAVEVISGQVLERQGISSLSDITQLSSSVQFDEVFTAADVRISIRGLSNTRGRSNVAFLVDGIDVTTENLLSAGSGLLANQRLLNDIQSVEIVKGPQSALYGRAAFAGAISYVTKEPGEEVEGKVALDAGSDGYYQLNGSIGGPVVGLEDKLGILASGAYWSEDGYYQNSISGADVGGAEGWGGVLTAVFTPTEEIEIKGRIEYTDNKLGIPPTARIGGGFTGTNMALFEYPVEMLGVLGEGSGTSTGLVNFGQVCPDELKDPSRGPGFCLPVSLGSASGNELTFSEDPVTGQDYKGIESQLFRASLIATFAQEYGTVTSYTGFTDYDAVDEHDQDYQALGRPDTLRSHQEARTDTRTEQFTQELRFASNIEGPVQFTVGGLYWAEDRDLDELNFITSCIEKGKDPVTGGVGPDFFVPGICDGSNGTITTWQERALDNFPCRYDPATRLPIPDPATGTCIQGPKTPVPWRADTQHWSLYTALAFDLSDSWTVTLEDRFVWEDFTLVRPNFSNCTDLGFPFGLVAFNPLVKEGPVTDASQDIVCISEQRMNPFLPAPPPDANGNDWFLIEGKETSRYNTPKVTVEWKATDDSLVYFSWAKAQKPGGINQLAGGATAVTIEQSRFKSEKMTAWEVGYKSSWEAAGYLQFNGAVFFQDYSDKQVTTQRIDAAGFSQPIVINASAAEVWGTELELIWQPSFFEGLALSSSYTYLHAEYTDFISDTTSILRILQNGQCSIVYTGKQGLFPDNESDPTNGGPKCRIDLGGNQLERSPEHAFVGRATLIRPFGDTGLEWLAELNGSYQDVRFIDLDNGVKLDDYWLMHARAGLTGDQWGFLVYVDNVFDDDTIRTGGGTPDFGQQVPDVGFTASLGVNQWYGLLPAPRTLGAKLSVRF